MVGAAWAGVVGCGSIIAPPQSVATYEHAATPEDKLAAADATCAMADQDGDLLDRSRCLQERAGAYAVRAEQRASAGDYDGAIADEETACKAAHGMPAADAAFAAHVGSSVSSSDIEQEGAAAQNCEVKLPEYKLAKQKAATASSGGAPASTGAHNTPVPSQATVAVSTMPSLSAPAPASSAPQAAPSPGTTGLVAASPQPNAYAVVIGIEKYAAGLPPPLGARHDAERFAELAGVSLGVSRDHVQLVLDDRATKGGIERALAWARDSTPPGGRIYFYFSGHGAPDASAGTPYLVPSDGDPKYLGATGIPMRDVLGALAQSKAREVLAIVDSCFSGAGGRSVLPPGARPLVRVKEAAAPAQLAFFSASTGSEISGPVPSGAGGLFTKYVVEGLGTGAADINGDGEVSLGELAQWVSPRVAREAKKDNRDQNPSLAVGRGLGSADSFIVEWGLPAR